MDSHLLKADELGIRLEIVSGLPIWEASPVLRHQVAIDRIRASIQRRATNSECVHFSDVYIQFPDGSLKRPDISIFCRQPEEQEEAVTLLPEAIIEVISKGYEAKDLQIGVPFYLAEGVKDIVVFNPYTDEVFHFRQNETLNLTSPALIELECGCNCTV